MTPRSEEADQAREDLRKTLATAKEARDKALENLEKQKEAVESEYWRTVHAALDGAYHGAQKDATEVLGVTRDHILKRTKKYAP
ncbi:hypothetical protein [Streptomyces vietnamensis]|uniref:Uncharacterized protein n=1 Tax=Streptomyces vietnamensis TaxID=362257 RepID=A0A0B5I8U7_9ACTN|nr:hypothetical protein [Streptomyces vietnamensis]AJF70450.1 hypothetical protein SVTN_40525 [Streptomyces vietnamensis]